MPISCLSPQQVERFRSDLEALAGPSPGRIGIAVSGGPDSLALLLLAAAAFPGQIEAATVDHGLRAESGSEAGLVAALCERIGIPHSVLKVEVASGGEGLQGEARRARYAALGQWAEQQGLHFIATAHHADDQAETLLMRLQRGAGLGGLAGIRPTRSLGQASLVRPVLGWTRSELAEIPKAAAIEAVDDPSNRDQRFDRVAMREFLAANRQFEPARLARSAGALGEANEALDWATRKLLSERVKHDGDTLLLDPQSIPGELVRRLLLEILAKLSPSSPTPRGEEVQRLARSLSSGASATLAGVKCKGGKAWRFETESPRRTPDPSALRSGGGK